MNYDEYFGKQSLEKIEKAITLSKEYSYIESGKSKKFDLQSIFNRFYKKIESELEDIGVSLVLKKKQKYHEYDNDKVYYFEILDKNGEIIAGSSLKKIEGLKTKNVIEAYEPKYIASARNIYYELRVACNRLLLIILEKLFPIMCEKNSMSNSEAVIVKGLGDEDVNKKEIAVNTILNETSMDAFYVEMDKSVYLYMDKELYEYEKNVLKSYEALLTIDDFESIEIVGGERRVPGSLTNYYYIELNRLQTKVRVTFDYKGRGYYWCSVKDSKINGIIDIKDMLTLDAIKEAFLGIYEDLALADIVGVTKDYDELFRGITGSVQHQGKELEILFREIREIIPVEESILAKDMRESKEAIFEKDEDLLNGHFYVKYLNEDGKKEVVSIEYEVLKASILGIDIGIFREYSINPDGSRKANYTAKKLEYFDAVFARNKIKEYKNMIN